MAMTALQEIHGAARSMMSCSGVATPPLEEHLRRDRTEDTDDQNKEHIELVRDNMAFSFTVVPPMAPNLW